MTTTDSPDVLTDGHWEPPCTRDADLWFSTAATDVAEAKRLCMVCPDRLACLTLAIETRDAWAVMGGLTPAERKPLLPPPTCALPGCDLPLGNGVRYCTEAHSRQAHKVQQRAYGQRRPLGKGAAA